MLLLILFAGCLASCAAQTTSFPSVPPGTSTITPLTQSVQPSPVLLTSNPADNVVAILATAVQSFQELNETTVGPVLNELSDILRMLQPDLNFSLTVKNITKV